MYKSLSRLCGESQMLATGFEKYMSALAADESTEYYAIDVLLKHFGGVEACNVSRPMAILKENDFPRGSALPKFIPASIEDLIDDPLFGKFNELILEKITVLPQASGDSTNYSVILGYAIANFIFNNDYPSEQIDKIRDIWSSKYSSLRRYVSLDVALAIAKWFIWLFSDGTTYSNTLLNKIDQIADSKRDLDGIRPYKVCECNQVEARFRAMLKIIALTDLSDPEKVVPMTEQMIDNVINGKSIHATQETEEPEAKPKEPEKIDGSEAVNIQRGQGKNIKTHKITARRACEIIKVYRLPILMSKEDCKSMLSMLLGLDETSFTKFL